MKNNIYIYHRAKIMVSMASIFIMYQVHACPTKVINDTQETVLIGDKTVKEIKILAPGTSDFLGAKDRKPVIIVYLKEYPKGPYKKKYEIKMIGCVKDEKDAIIHINSIIQDTYDKQLFSATPYVNQHKMLITTPEHVKQ